MDLPQLSSEEIETIRATVPWMKIFGGGSLATFVLTLWKAFGLYRRLDDVEKELKEMRESGLMTIDYHNLLAESCQKNVKSEIEKQTTALHIKWLEEMRELREDSLQQWSSISLLCMGCNV